MVYSMSNNGEKNPSLKFDATIRSQNRITVPPRLSDFKEGDKVIVLIRKAKSEAVV